MLSAWYPFQGDALSFIFQEKFCFSYALHKQKSGLYWSLKCSYPCFYFYVLFKTVRKWKVVTRNISTSFWNLFTCPHRLCIWIVQPLSNLFKRWFVVFQWYLMIDMPFTIIFSWHTFCELLFNVLPESLDITSWVLCRAQVFIVFQGIINTASYNAGKVSKGITCCTLIFLFEMFADITLIAGSTKISYFFMLTTRSSVTALTLWRGLLMLANRTTTTSMTDQPSQIVWGNLFSTTGTTGWSSFIVVTNLTPSAFATNFFEPVILTFSVFFVYFFAVQTFWTMLRQLCSWFVDPKTLK